MPELPEVETISTYLRPLLAGKLIKQIIILSKNLRLPIPVMLEDFTDVKVNTITRRSKYLLLECNNQYTILIHLGMSGKLFAAQSNYTPIKHDHYLIVINDAVIVYNDPRRFGLIACLPSADLATHELLVALGPEPLTADFDPNYFFAKTRNRNTPIKTLLMNNQIVVGIGNIYANEALFYARIHPERKSGSLTEAECTQLVKTAKMVLQKAIDLGGSSIRDWVKLDNSHGGFQNNFAVYGKNNLPCVKCLTPIVMIRFGGRASFYCPTCQN